MKKPSALALLADVTRRSGLPLVDRVLDVARRRAEELRLRVVGHDFDERVAWLRRRYDSMGGDPFGLDPDVAKRVVTVLSFFHRLYFRLDLLQQGRTGGGGAGERAALARDGRALADLSRRCARDLQAV